jgi:hypothetical protein
MKQAKTFSEIRRDFQSDVAKIKQDYKRDAPKLSRGAKATAYALVSIVALFAVASVFGPTDEERYCSNTDRASSTAYAAAQVHIRDRLRDPSSAEMPPEAISSSWLGDCSFRVVGVVRARNGFGGYGSQQYAVTVTYSIRVGGFIFSDLVM